MFTSQIGDSNDRHLDKTVRVTAAVCRGLAQLKLGLTDRYWTGLRGYTDRFQLAAPYVFVKQSDLSCNCDLLIIVKQWQ